MAVFVALCGLGLFYFLGYRRWSYYLASKVLGLSDDEKTPAHDSKLQDNIDYLPVKKSILWGHHYTSIAGAAPIIGPAVAVIWGWVPALIWVLLGAIFIGAVHDFGALVISVRHQGRSMADISGDVIHPRVRLLFQSVIYFLIWIVLAVFAFAIGVLFNKYPASVIPINFEIIVALVMGYCFIKKGKSLLWPSLLALLGLYLMIVVGIYVPVSLPHFLQGDPVVSWGVLLLAYAAIASLLPVWALLQPRDYINSHQLIVGLVLLFAGLFMLNPDFTAPALNLYPEGAPSLFPMIFVTIACGAISGFHGLVSSGTTSKQLNKMTDARSIGYGGMLGEGTLALIATLAVAAGLEDWGAHYGHFNSSGILAIANFVKGAGSFLQATGLSLNWAHALVAVLVISFAATSLDTGARIQRLLIMEIGKDYRLPWLKNRFVATAIAVGPSVPLVLAGPKIWGPLWMLFGTTNQLIAAITMLVLVTYLYKARKPVIAYLTPCLFVLFVTGLAMLFNLLEWIPGVLQGEGSARGITVFLGGIIFIFQIWIVAEAILAFNRIRKERPA